MNNPTSTTTLSFKSKRIPTSSFFTLIELMVVLVILMVLVSILLPSLGQARAKSKAVVCINQQKQIGLAFLMFSEDNQGRLPSGFTSTPNWYSWTARLTPYLGPVSPPLWGASSELPVFFCPASTLNASTPYPPTYASNPWLIGDSVWGSRPVDVPINLVHRPEEVLLILDCTQGADGKIHWAQILMRPGNQDWWLYSHHEGGGDLVIDPGLDVDGIVKDQIRYRHQRHTNVLFTDYHVEEKGYYQLKVKNFCYYY